LPTLPRAEAEVRMAASILGPRSVVLVGDAATETALKHEDSSSRAWECHQTSGGSAVACRLHEARDTQLEAAVATGRGK
jgi:hypothetical protein